MIDRQLVTRKMSLILEDLAAMTRLSKLSRGQYLEDSVNEALAERYLERVIGRIIVADRGSQIPVYLDHIQRFVEKLPKG